MNKIVILALIVLSLCSCSNYKNIPYLQNSSEFDGSKGALLYDMTIKPKDQLAISVFSGSDQDAVDAFNLIDPIGIDYSRKEATIGNYGRLMHPYLVDNEGNVEFPIVGKIQLAGKTIKEAEAQIKKLITPYFQAGIDLVVTVRLDNYEVTVMGEVEHPGSFAVSNQKVNVLEALAMAGDMTIYGKRDNVKILREIPDGTYEVHELDMRDANILNSPYYYLQQRDIVYVEPNEVMAKNASISQTRQLWVRGASITISLGSLLYRVLK